MKQTILIVDDEPVQRRLLEASIIKAGHHPLKAESGEEAIKILDEPSSKISLVILDLMMPGIDGMGVLKHLQSKDTAPPVIVQTATGGIETVVNAMRIGAFDFIVKPISPDRLLSAIDKALKFKSAVKAPLQKQKPAKVTFRFDDIITKSPIMEPVIAMGKKAAASNIPVLIEGETGVGKELIARAIHGSSARADKPLVIVNCGALPENLVESILFGHEKGAFTGANEKHIGKFEEADGGTLFLDEIGELALDLQVKLLRAIQEGLFDPVGGRKTVKSDVRLVSATNRDLFQEVKMGNFREDLYYRLNVLPMTIPPLRQRKDDLESLLYHFIKKISREENRNNISAVKPEVLKTLKAYHWPGNIRELENAVFRAIVLCDGEEITNQEFPQILSQLPNFEIPEEPAGKKFQTAYAPLKDNEPNQSDEEISIGMETPVDNAFSLPEASSAQPGHQLPGENQIQSATSNYGMIQLINDQGEIKNLSTIEEEAIRFAIEIYNGRMSEISRKLGIGRSTLYRKLKELGLAEPHDEV